MAKELRIQRPISEMVEELRADVALLREYTGRAFRGREDAFCGEVAGKLRVLVHNKGCNKPLLLALMGEFGIDVKLPFDQPGIKADLSVPEYLDLMAYGHQIEGRGFVQVKNKELVEVWSQQAGASHKDWSIDECFHVARECGIYLGGLPAVAACLACIARTILFAADDFLSRLTPEMIAAKR